MATFLALTSKQFGETGLGNVRARQIFLFSKFSRVWLQIPGIQPGATQRSIKAYKFQVWKEDMMTEQLFSHQIRDKNLYLGWEGGGKA